MLHRLYALLQQIISPGGGCENLRAVVLHHTVPALATILILVIGVTTELHQLGWPAALLSSPRQRGLRWIIPHGRSILLHLPFLCCHRWLLLEPSPHQLFGREYGTVCVVLLVRGPGGQMRCDKLDFASPSLAGCAELGSGAEVVLAACFIIATALQDQVNID